MAATLCLFVSFLILLSDLVAGADNPADKLVETLNNNRTAHNSSSLFDNTGLGCLALQYIKAFSGQCSEVDSKKPPDSEFVDTFSPNCGVQANTLSSLTGRILGCQTHYIPPTDAFSDILMKDRKSLDILYNTSHTQVGAAVSGSDGGSPYFWCLLFSGGRSNSTFLLDGGQAKVQRPGCFSGADDDCSSAHSLYGHLLQSSILSIATMITLVLALS